MKFLLFAKEELLGESLLESGDTPMGVAFGKFIPNKNYFKYQPLFEAKNLKKIDGLKLSLVSELGEELSPCSGIAVEDFTNEIGEQYIEVSVLGLDGSLYEKLFRHHLETYENQFK